MKEIQEQQNELTKILETFKDIPFGNTDFQIENFVINSSLTPERAFRAVGLNIISKIETIQNVIYETEKLKIDLEELREILEEKKLGKFDLKRKQLDYEFKSTQLLMKDKAINDLTHELNVYYKYYQNLPKFSKEQFEQAEFKYYEQHLMNQMKGHVGAAEALLSMGKDIHGNSVYDSHSKKLNERIMEKKLT